MTFRKNTSIGQLGGQAAGDGPEDLLRAMVQRLVQEAIQAEFDRFIGAGRFERTATRRGWRNGFKPRTLKTRVGKLVLRISAGPGRPVSAEPVRALPAKREGAHGRA